MLIQLLREFLGRYRVPLIFVTVLQLIQTIANLYLPNLNADIIDNGVVTGDTAYIWRIGMLMLGGLTGPDRRQHRRRLLRRPAPPWASAATSGRPCSIRSARSPPANSTRSVRRR